MKKNTSLKLIIILILFFIISLISIYSAQTITNNQENLFFKQLIFYIIGIIALLIGYFFQRQIIKYHFLSYIIINLLLLFLLILGISINGSKCWIFIGPFSFQPSEFMKINLIITISYILSTFNNKDKSIKKEFFLLLKIFIILLIPSILTFLEPDTGVVIIYFIITISLIISKKLNKKWYLFATIIIAIIGILITTLYFFKYNLLIKILGNNLFYRIDRLLKWSNQSGYQLENSLIAIGSSGLTGFGFNQTPIYFPESSTDFIFTTFSSNFGFMGSILLIVLIIIFDTIIINVSKKRLSKLNHYIIIGFITMIFYQQIQNICMTIGLLPITGITLPFISYGGSSLLSYMLILGIIIRIINDNQKYLNH